MRIENDEVFNAYFAMEFDRIPFVFRFGKKRLKVMVPVLIFLIVLMCVSWSVFYSTQESHYISPPLDGYEPICINSYDYRILAVTIVAAILVFLVSLWMVISELYERRAFAKATDLTARLTIDRQERAKEIYQDWKLHNIES
jgi:TRAP-type C4-dicarboxylate transport system permease small subunit